MKKVKSLKALVLSLMLCLAMGTTAFASEVSTQGQAAPNANKAVEVSDCGDLDVVPAYDDAVALADTIQYDANRTITRSNSLEFPYFYPHFSAFTGSAINNFQKITKI